MRRAGRDPNAVNGRPPRGPVRCAWAKEAPWASGRSQSRAAGSRPQITAVSQVRTGQLPGRAAAMWDVLVTVLAGRVPRLLVEGQFPRRGSPRASERKGVLEASLGTWWVPGSPEGPLRTSCGARKLHRVPRAWGHRGCRQGGRGLTAGPNVGSPRPGLVRRGFGHSTGRTVTHP